MTWYNSDGLFVKFGVEEAAVARGGEKQRLDGVHEYTFEIDWKDVLSASTAVLGTVGTAALPRTGSYGVMIPKGLKILEVETIAVSAFTSSGTIGSSTMVIGLIREDFSTELDYDGLTTSSFVGSVFDGLGETVNVRLGTTGAGALIGTTLAYDGIVTVSNSAHASHPYTAGRLRVTVKGIFPTA